MNDISHLLHFSDADIDTQNYTLNILILCSMHNIISDDRIAEIRQSFDYAFIETAEQFTKRESSTIPKKHAEILYSSVLYQADVYLLSLNSLSKAIDELNTVKAEIILERGRTLILSIHEVNQRIFKCAYKNKLQTKCYEYNYVMEKSFDEYFKGYSARFDARNCCASIDYPLLGCQAYNIKSQGVMFINEYYTAIMHENEFCQHFNRDKIGALLIGFGEIYECKYTELLFNIAEVIFNNFLGCMLSDKPYFELELNESDIELISNKCAYYQYNTLLHEIYKLFSKCESELNNTRLYKYLQKYIPIFTHELSKRISFGGLNKFFVCFSYK